MLSITFLLARQCRSSLAIIDFIEDKMNAEHDILEIGVQTIILVEDSVRYYSSFCQTFTR